MKYDNQVVLYGNSPGVGDQGSGYLMISVHQHELEGSDKCQGPGMVLPPAGLYARGKGDGGVFRQLVGMPDAVVQVQAGNYETRVCLQRAEWVSQGDTRGDLFQECLVEAPADSAFVLTSGWAPAAGLPGEHDDVQWDTRTPPDPSRDSEVMNLVGTLQIKPGTLTYLEIRQDLKQSCGAFSYFRFRTSYEQVRTLELPMVAEPKDLAMLAKTAGDPDPALQIVAFESICLLGKRDASAVQPTLATLQQAPETRYLAEQVKAKISQGASSSDPCLIPRNPKRIWTDIGGTHVAN